MRAGGACGQNVRPLPVPAEALRQVLAGVHAGSCPGELNFHCHTICSDGSLRPQALGEQAVALGLRHFAVTDHHSIAAIQPLQAWLVEQATQGRTVPQLWAGVEISCLLEGCLVHVLALGFEAGHADLAPYCQGRAPVGTALRAQEVCRRIHSAGGLALLAHPARYRLPFQRLIEAAYYDYTMQPQWAPSPLVCDAIASQLDNLGLLRSCGTDTHGLQLSGR